MAINTDNSTELAARGMPASAVENKLKKGGLTGIGVGIAALVACELPMVLTLVGLGTFAAGAGVFKPPFWLEVVALTSAALGLIMLVMIMIRRRRQACV